MVPVLVVFTLGHHCSGVDFALVPISQTRSRVIREHQR